MSEIDRSDLDDDVYKIEGSGDGYSYTITRKSDGALMVKDIPTFKYALQMRRELHKH